MPAEKPWFAHYEKGVPHHLEVPPVPLHRLLEASADRFPDRVAVEFLGKQTTFRELLDQVRRFATALQALGVRRGDRVAIMLPNSPQFLIAFYGASMAGAVAVNTSPLYVARELAHQMVDSEAETLIMLDQFFPRYQEVAGEIPVKRVIVTGIQDALPFPKNLLYPLREKLKKRWTTVKPQSHVHFLPQLLARHSPNPARVDFAPDDVALLQYTGGTTGVPKGAMLSHRNLVSNTYQCRAWMRDLIDGQEVVLGAIPFFHVYGMTVAMNLSVMMGAALVLVPNPRDLKMLLGIIQKRRPTVFPAVPTLYNAINNHPDTPQYDLSSIRACISGSAPLPIETAHKFKEITRGANLVEGYGLTETSPVTHVNPIYGENRTGTIGLPLPGVDARVVDQDGHELPPGEIGELAVSGPNVMLGYWRNETETARALRSLEGGATWLMTGDMATMDQDGYFRIVDRKKDLIIAGGYNIYPREVEEVLYAHPAVLEAAVVGVPDPYRGETVKAFLVLRPGTTATAEEISAFCRERLSPYKVPRQVEFRSELPKTAVGKILRRALLESSST
ncbi:long-chain acyl-CoA synthetase [Deinobacterium chartae]|uniref:Long-chain acyl-CoA synthetase n=1 Tax=Deinobacterium chartae TaxID=521158 RepID=A0A841HZ81_9DEIO|nr:long-chain fatty acid--CoA ligase [Deinobacterium chartae]MBB6098176.1 long-chain acyl-CoA synthetase [Deinobacterium chartae]